MAVDSPQEVAVISLSFAHWMGMRSSAVGTLWLHKAVSTALECGQSLRTEAMHATAQIH